MCNGLGAKNDFSHTTGYVLDLMQPVFEENIHHLLPYLEAVLQIPVPQDLCAQLDRHPTRHTALKPPETPSVYAARYGHFYLKNPQYQLTKVL
jgi:hypothetical protein